MERRLSGVIAMGEEQRMSEDILEWRHVEVAVEESDLAHVSQNGY